MKAVIKEILGASVYLLIVLILTYLVITFVGQRTVVHGVSMETTLSDGDNLIVDKISYRFHLPQRYDIVVFPYQYEKDIFYIKRIIGMPGESVYIDEVGNIYINNEIISESYGREVIQSAGLASTTLYLGADEYFVLGDNRNNSSDSRDPSVGLIKEADIIGRAWFRMYPFDQMGFVKHS